jgi:hypothetical protein
MTVVSAAGALSLGHEHELMHGAQVRILRDCHAQSCSNLGRGAGLFLHRCFWISAENSIRLRTGIAETAFLGPGDQRVARRDSSG